MVEVAVFVDATQVFGGHPLVATHDLHFAHDIGRAGLAFGVLHFDDAARYGLAQRTVLDREVGGAGIRHQDDADFGGAIHAADGGLEQGFNKAFGGTVDGFAGERQLVEVVFVVVDVGAVAHHAVVRGGRRHVGEAVFAQGL